MTGEDWILLVDDDRDFAGTLREFLEARGHRVAVADTGQAALAQLREGLPALVLLDLRLPDTDGVELMREAMRQEVPPEVVIVTGEGTLDSAIAAVEAGAVGYVLKPFRFAELTALVSKALERRRLGRENARLGAELADRLRETEALLAISTTVTSTLDLREALRQLCRALVKLLGADTGAAYFHDIGADQLVPYAAYHVPKEHLEVLARETLPLREQGFYLPIWKERRAVHSDDVARDPRFSHEMFRRFAHQSGLLLPLVLDDEVVGAFYIVWWTGCRQLTEREVQLVEKVSGQVQVLLRNARLYEAGELDRRSLAALNEVSRRLAAVHEPQAILSLIVNEATRLLGAEAAGIRLLEGDDLVVAARTESAAELMARPRIKVGESLTGAVVATGEPVAVEDLLEDTRYDRAHKRGALTLGFHGFLGVPLRGADRTIGALNVYTKSRRRFTPDEVALLAAFADQASLAIEKGRLYGETRAREREATKLYEITSQLASSLDLDRVLDLITAKTLDLLGCDAAGIYVYDEARAGLTFRRGLHLDRELTQNLVLKPGEGVAGRAFQERRPVWTRDRLADPSLTYSPAADSLIKARAPRAYLAVPIISRGDVNGVLVGYFFTPHDYTSQEVRLLSTLADQAAIAIDNSRLYEEAQTQRRHLREIFDSTSDGIIRVGRDGRIQAANRRADELLAFSGVADVLAGGETPGVASDPALGALRALLEDPEARGEGDLEVAATRRILHWVGRPTKDAGGATVGVTMTFQDVTQEREVSRMKSDFVSFATHQLRTPLSGIKWLLELAGQGTDIPEETRSYVQDAQDASERLIRLVNDLLNVSRLESGKLAVALEPTDLGEVTRQVLDEIAPLVRDKGHRISVAGAEALPPTLVDPQLMREAVLNLVSNAVKYTLPGGEIAIRMSCDGTSACWAIRDSGVGIPKHAQQRLFEKFYRADNVLAMETEGTGLGLYLVRLIIERFGGRIWCESDEGKGATFAFVLPLAETRG